MSQHFIRNAAVLALALILAVGLQSADGPPPLPPQGEASPWVGNGEQSLPDDPFAELLESSPAQVTKTGPSCSFIRIPLPTGVSPDEIPGL